MRWAKMAELK